MLLRRNAFLSTLHNVLNLPIYYRMYRISQHLFRWQISRQSIHSMPCFCCSSDKKTRSLSKSFVVTFVRHGETEMNVQQIIQSRGEGELTSRGIHMAEMLGKSMRNELFTRAYNSDRKRTRDTLTHIIKYLRTNPRTIIPYPILRERDLGDLEGKPNSIMFEIAKEHPELTHISIPIPGGESYDDTKARCAKFFYELCAMADRPETATENILVVTHAIWLVSFIDWLASCEDFELTNVDWFKLESFPANTAVTKLIIQNSPSKKRKIEFLKLHDTSHLMS
ncbi:Fructose-2,6-bisphosphatase TIGAR [Orchesella cincta]|uniref:Fructose-2,6-bisphosphatase TIGAR n=1 Tax=Orchesella cincta TaxID=48709 RepID=A0A1D2MJI8_ORCCI|nr:Fructose-2,6-bisphosphatase TIGAR [Orchesella cincta]